MMDTTLIYGILEDALFAAMAAIGFSTISHTPRRCWFVCALAAAAGHALRYVLMGSVCGMNIIPASALAGLAVGVVAVVMTPLVKTPAEACLFPALLPMIPGMYAYRAVETLVACVEPSGASRSVEPLLHNGITCILIVFGLVIGGTIPIFLFKRISFQATR